ncbi:MAG: preprotein translocase subunit SecE [bacterium]
MHMVGQVKQFLSEVRAEMKKITWPTKAHTINSTIVVLIATAIITIFLYLCDVGLARVISRLIK